MILILKGIVKMAKFLDIQQDAIKRYGITLCYGELCKNDWQRTHVHVREKRICNIRNDDSNDI